MSTATDMLAAYIAAETAVLSGKSYQIGGRSKTLSDLTEIQKGRKEWEVKVAAESAAARSAPSIGGSAFSHSNFNNAPHSRFHRNG